MKLQRNPDTQKAGFWLAILPPTAFLWLTFLIFIVTSNTVLRRHMSWHVHSVTLSIFLAVEFLLLRAFIKGSFRLHAASAAALCGVALYTIIIAILL
ncbi:hypothetical protein [Leisingera sp. HS039]|nr:hypothetical protein [Leisingera sp. HS039]